jgi:hypothetical protein
VALLYFLRRLVFLVAFRLAFFLDSLARSRLASASLSSALALLREVGERAQGLVEALLLLLQNVAGLAQDRLELCVGQNPTDSDRRDSDLIGPEGAKLGA